MRHIHFRFDPEKLVAALALFASRGVNDLDAMKSAKLLYFADKAHLLRYGRPILGDDYYGMEHGPVPTASYNMIKDALSPEGVEASPSLLSSYLDVDRSGKYPRFLAKAEPDLDALSPSDVEVIEETLRRYGKLSAWDLRQLAHQQPEVQYADEQLSRSHRGSVPIPFQLFFDREQDKPILSAVEDAQEDRDFAESLAW